MASSQRIIGVDESGKGDFFGPLVVAGCLASNDDLAVLSAMGVRDSKKIADKKLLTIDKQLRARFVFSVVVYPPIEYNRLYEKIRNLNILLAGGHTKAIAGCLSQGTADLAISDKFGKSERLEVAMADAGCSLPVKQMVRGEAIPQVAAASIIARAEFVRQMARLSADYGMVLPKGAAPQVDAAGRDLVARCGASVLVEVAKTHFKNYGRALQNTAF